MNKTELKLLEQVAKGNIDIKEIAKALSKSKKQVSRTAKKLIEFIVYEKGKLAPVKDTKTILLLQVLSKHPNLAEILSGHGIEILTAAVNQKIVKEIIKETGLKKSVVYQKLKQAYDLSIVTKEKTRYRLNIKLWNNLKGFLEEYERYNNLTDPRIPVDSTIYYKKDEEIIFSTKQELSATKTAFSAYDDYGIKLRLITNYYYLPKKKLAKKEILLHCLRITEKDKNIKNIIFTALFYIKYKIRIKHPILDMIDKVLEKRKVPDYPTYNEIKEKAEVYSIKIR